MAQRISDSLRLLLEIGETATAAEDMGQLFEKIVDSIVLAMDVDVVSLMLLEEDGRLRIRAARGLPPEIIQETRIASGEGISGQVLASGKAILVEDLAQDGFPPSGGSRYWNQSLLSVPIRYSGRILGVINVNNKHAGGAFTSADRDLLTAIAHQAALAVENFHLVDDLRRQARQLAAANRDLRRLHQIRSRLVCNLSHELNTPLTSILGYIDLILNYPEGINEGEINDYLHHVYRQGQRMERLITSMLQLFSLDAGEEEWQVDFFSLVEIAGEILLTRTEDILGKRLQLKTELPERLPTMRGDRKKTAVLLEALIDNAIKFNRPGGRLGIRAEARQENGTSGIYLQVHNDGDTVPAEAFRDIFSGFHQLGNLDTQKPVGLGIGLATCRAIVERMEGTIFLEPTAGEGTTFGIFLPVAKGGESP